jgi:hypothetical protein
MNVQTPETARGPGDSDPRTGTAWEKGERLAKLVAHRRTLLVLDGLEPLQNPPGPQEGRLREPALQALLRELAAFNTGLFDINIRQTLSFHVLNIRQCITERQRCIEIRDPKTTHRSP